MCEECGSVVYDVKNILAEGVKNNCDAACLKLKHFEATQNERRPRIGVWIGIVYILFMKTKLNCKTQADF